MENKENKMTLISTKMFDSTNCDFYCDSSQNEYYLTREQIGTALEYSDPIVAIGKIHDRHAERLDKFSTLTNLVKVEGT